MTKLLSDGTILKIFHFARFDLGALQKRLAVMPTPVYCTKIASRLARTYTDKHGLKDFLREVLESKCRNSSSPPIGVRMP